MKVVVSRITAAVATALALAAGAGAAHAQAQAPAQAAAPAPNTLGPQQLVEDSAKRMLGELDANRAMYRSDPEKLDALVANVLLPNFDVDYAARLVLGQPWRTATADQRQRFVKAFYHSMSKASPELSLPVTADRSMTAARPSAMAAAPTANRGVTVVNPSAPVTRERSPLCVSNAAVSGTPLFNGCFPARRRA